MNTWEADTPIDDDQRDSLIRILSWSLVALRKGLNLKIELKVCTPDNIIKEEKHGFDKKEHFKGQDDEELPV